MQEIMTYPWPYTGQGEWSSRVHQRLRLNSKSYQYGASLK